MNIDELFMTIHFMEIIIFLGEKNYLSKYYIENSFIVLR